MTSVPPLVSVIVPCYRVTAFIVEALEALRAQSFRDFETIVVNDGCPDTEALEQVLVPYRSEITYIKQENRGLSGARNTGLEAARGPLVALLDGDDVWNPNYLEVQVAYLREHPEVDVVYPNAVFIGETTWNGRIFRDMFPSRGDVTVHSLLSRECIVNVSVTGRRGTFLKVGLFDIELRSGEDWDIWLRMAKAGSRLAYHDHVLYQYRVRKGALSSDKLNLPRAGMAVLNKFLRRLDLDDEERRLTLRVLRDYQSQLSFVQGRIAAYRGNSREAISHLSQANEVMRSWRVGAAIVVLRVAPWLLYHVIHRRYPTEYEFLH